MAVFSAIAGFEITLLFTRQFETRKIVHYGFTELGLNRIEARCNYNNPGSYRVMEKLGMQFEGVLRKQLKIKGQFIDQRMYSILKSDYESSLN